MQHIVNIAFDFDDEKVKATAEKTVDNELSQIIKDIVTDKIAPRSPGWYGENGRDWTLLNRRIDDAVSAFLEENKDAIMEMAAKDVANTLKKSKRYKAVLAALE